MPASAPVPRVTLGKSVHPKGTVGSNPTLSANYPCLHGSLRSTRTCPDLSRDFAGFCADAHAKGTGDFRFGGRRMLPKGSPPPGIFSASAEGGSNATPPNGLKRTSRRPAARSRPAAVRTSKKEQEGQAFKRSRSSAASGRSGTRPSAFRQVSAGPLEGGTAYRSR